MSKKVTKQHILAFINASRIPGREISLENLKENALTAEERFRIEKMWGAEVVKEIFGEPSHLQKAEMRILAIEEGEIDAQKKCEYIIEIAYAIEDCCGTELDSNNPIWEEYSDLTFHIPISILKQEGKRSNFDFLDFQKKKLYIRAADLEKMKDWIFRAEEAEYNLSQKVFFEYIFELAYISLKNIFFAVKHEIIGE